MVLVIRKFHPYVKSEVDTKELQPSMTMESEENRQTENNKVSSFKEFMKKLDDIKNESDEDQDKIKNNQEDERTKHELIQIPPTEKKKWPQKPCVYCRREKFEGIQDIYVPHVMLLSVKIVFVTIMRILKNIFS